MEKNRFQNMFIGMETLGMKKQGIEKLSAKTKV